MRATDTDALICDFAQYYKIYDINRLGIRRAAVLACGLPADSRIMMKLRQQEMTTDTMLKVAMLDAVHSFEYAYIKAHTEKNKHIEPPKPLMSIFMGKEEEGSAETFAAGEDFEKAREKLIGG